jgi:hypothetical protein
VAEPEGTAERLTRVSDWLLLESQNALRADLAPEEALLQLSMCVVELERRGIEPDADGEMSFQDPVDNLAEPGNRVGEFLHAAQLLRM